MPQAYNPAGHIAGPPKVAEVYRPASDLADVRPLPVEHEKGRDLQGLEKDRVATNAKKEEGLRR